MLSSALHLACIAIIGFVLLEFLMIAVYCIHKHKSNKQKKISFTDVLIWLRTSYCIPFFTSNGGEVHIDVSRNGYYYYPNYMLPIYPIIFIVSTESLHAILFSPHTISNLILRVVVLTIVANIYSFLWFFVIKNLLKLNFFLLKKRRRKEFDKFITTINSNKDILVSDKFVVVSQPFFKIIWSKIRGKYKREDKQINLHKDKGTNIAKDGILRFIMVVEFFYYFGVYHYQYTHDVMDLYRITIFIILIYLYIRYTEQYEILKLQPKHHKIKGSSL